VPQDPQIQLIYADRGDDPDSKFFGMGRSPQIRVGEVSPATLSENLSRLCAAIGTAIDTVDLRNGNFCLSTFDVTVEITGSGEVRLNRRRIG